MIWKEPVVTSSKYIFGIFVERPRKNVINFNQDNRCPGKDSNGTPHPTLWAYKGHEMALVWLRENDMF
jgi:hypothetical protein